MSRYYDRIPDPKCDHKAVQRVEAGDPKQGAHAATYVCGRSECVQDATEWAFAITHQEPRILPFGGAR